MIRFLTLGGLDLNDSVRGELRTVLTQPKRAALLAYLALADSSGFRRRDTLVALFWPESDEIHARAALRQAVRFLRRALEDGVVLSRGEEEIGISTKALWVDAIAFERAVLGGQHTEALDLYRGPFLNGLHVSESSPELEQWIEGTRSRYSRLAAVSAWNAAEAHRKSGDSASASTLARRAYDIAPEDEAGLRRLLTFLDELGDRSSALAIYDAFARRLSAEGEEASPETKATVEVVRSRSVQSPRYIAAANAPVAIPVKPNANSLSENERTQEAPPIGEPTRRSPSTPARVPFFSRRAVSIATGIALSLVIVDAVIVGRRADAGSTPSPAAVTAGANVKSNASKAAVQKYVQGRYWWNKRGPGLLKSIGFFNQALDADPMYAPAYSGMGDAYVQLGYASALAPSDAFPKARAAAQRALDLDPTLAEPHATLAYVAMYYDWNWKTAEQEFKRAIELGPNYATAHEWYGLFLAAMGRFDDARTQEKRAEELDALSTPIAGTAAWVLYYAGQNEAARQALQIVLRTDSTFALGHFYLGRAEEAAGNYDRALTQYEATGPLRGSVPTLAARGHLLGLVGRKKEAEAVLARLDSMSQHQYVTAYGVALVYQSLGQKDSAFIWLDRGVSERTHWLVWLNRDPRWRPLRADPRFKSLVRRVGLPD
jgi:DNA-binding SARP family transcriptional activator/Tfp pilus assembly protein PilF